MKEDRFKENSTLYKGYLFNKYTNEKNPVISYTWDYENISKLADDNEKILLDLIGKIKKDKLEVIFIIPNRVFNKEDMRKLNYISTIIQQNQLNIINFNTIENLNIDFNTDLYNPDHINVYGATKYTLYFSKYLKDNYELPNHSNDYKYSSWNEEYKRFKEDFMKLNSQEFEELIEEYKEQT